MVALLLLWDRLSEGKSSGAAAVVRLEECEIAAFFSPRGGCEEAIVSAIDAAKKTVDCAVYTFTSRPIAQALVRAKRRGVKVRVIVDRTQSAGTYSKKRYLLKKGIPVRTHIGEGLMHNKFAVIDTAIVVTGSFNWTASANEYNYENLLVIRSRALAKAFEREFGILWRRFE